MGSESTVDNPIAFFQHFLNEGYKSLYQSFFEPDELLYIYYNKLEIDKKGKSKFISVDKEDQFKQHYVFEETYYFTSILKNLINNEQRNSIQLIDERLYKLTLEEQKNFIELLFLKIVKLINDFKRELVDEEDSAIIIDYLKKIIVDVCSTFEHLTPNNPNVKSILRNTILRVGTNDSLISFKMEPQYFAKIDLLFNQLCLNDFIDRQTNLNLFKQAFDGGILNNHLMIRWTMKVKNKLSKAIIFQFIYRLIKESIINDDNAITKKIGAIFIDHNGSALENLASSNSQIKNKKSLTPEEKELYRIIDDFKKNVTVKVTK